jgi:hypothetical protein
MQKQSRSKRKIPWKLKKASWSEFLVLFNKKHNPQLVTKLGKVNVKTKNYTQKKNKK